MWSSDLSHVFLQAFVTQDTHDRDLLQQNLQGMGVPIINARDTNNLRAPSVTPQVKQVVFTWMHLQILMSLNLASSEAQHLMSLLVQSFVTSWTWIEVVLLTFWLFIPKITRCRKWELWPGLMKSYLRLRLWSMYLLDRQPWIILWGIMKPVPMFFFLVLLVNPCPILL